MVWGTFHGECQEFHGICTQHEVVAPKVDAWTSAPIPHPLCCELAIYRMKRGGVEVIRDGCDQYFHGQNANVEFYTPPITLHQTFHPLSSLEALENVCMNTHSFLFILPRGVSPIWCWASNGQFTLCGASSVSLPSGVFFL